MGFEPTISTVTGWRALQAAPRGQVQAAGLRLQTVGAIFSPAACGLTSAVLSRSPGWTRTTDLLFVGELPLPLGYRTVKAGCRPLAAGWRFPIRANTLVTMRDHTKLRAFELADQLVLHVYKATGGFPREELFGITSQMRRASVSIACNIVEGCGRETQAECVRFLEIAYGSSREVEYQVSLAYRLKFLSDDAHADLSPLAVETSKVLGGLVRSLRQ
jgi:four helix bundle protein